ncbi:MAG: MATE family efflux transporter [Deltaproteobacteria bacterium]|nr:MATE family efflux transporter [Deltaproteobacteria bacterium]
MASLLVRLSLPGITANIAFSLYNVVDTFWVAQLGHEAIAALTIVFPYQILAMAVGMGTGTGIGALVSKNFGEKNFKTTNLTAGHIFSLSIIWGLVFLMPVILFSETILIFLGATKNIMSYAKTYLIVTSFGAPANVFVILVGSLIRGSGDAVKPTIIMVTSSILNIILDPLLILGLGPFPGMGIKGAAIATVISQGAGMLIGLFYLLGNKTSFRLRGQYLIPRWLILKKIYYVGAPASVQQLTESLAFILFNKLVSIYGSIPIAAVGIAMRLSDLAFMPIMGVSNALLPVVGYNLGTGNQKRLWKSIKLSTIGMVILLALFTIIIEIWTPEIVGIFIKDSEGLNVTIPGMRIMLSAMVFIGPSILFITAFQGLSMGGTALWLSLVRQFILFVPLLFLLENLLGLTGIWFALPLSDVLSFNVIFAFLLREYSKRKKRMAINCIKIEYSRCESAA